MTAAEWQRRFALKAARRLRPNRADRPPTWPLCYAATRSWVRWTWWAPCASTGRRCGCGARWR